MTRPPASVMICRTLVSEPVAGYFHKV